MQMAGCLLPLLNTTKKERSNNMKHLKHIGTVLFIMVLLSGCASSQKEMPSGSIHFEQWQFMAILGGDWGEGSVGFNGKTYKFKVKGIGVGGIGGQKLSATGSVYNMNDISDLEGTYFQARAGLTVVKGRGGLWLKNNKGVTLHIVTKTTGLALSVGMEGLNLELVDG
jgi:hypothetical protein